MSAPVSLGILIQTTKMDAAYRKQMTDTLADLVRHLREGDEAFILAFSDRLDFVQDLTDNPKLLEEAVDSLKPASGGALFDAVSFAAGHMRRLAKNKNRILLVISDGTTAEQQANSFDIASQLQDVRIDCIGVDVANGNARRILENLSRYSSGVAQFADDGRQFRAATHDIAMRMGIDFQQ